MVLSLSILSYIVGPKSVLLPPPTVRPSDQHTMTNTVHQAVKILSAGSPGEGSQPDRK